MIFDSILSAVGDFLTWVVGTIPGIDISSLAFAESLELLVEGSKVLNFILPIEEALVMVGIAVAIKLALLLFWAAMKLISFIPGVG